MRYFLLSLLFLTACTTTGSSSDPGLTSYFTCEGQDYYYTTSLIGDGSLRMVLDERVHESKKTVIFPLSSCERKKGVHPSHRP